ncbi:hypothetical protein HOY82DRAFT_613931 [Tuber indicum]|nr:hypothetical protein HOY82DRAFT_613928 [Tuber indicum]KAG0127134.1 hypothetical protein HOY82DRAFT_613931 [Tuber indicum]
MSTTNNYVVTHTFTKTVIIGMILKVISDVTMSYFRKSGQSGDQMTVNQYNEAAVAGQNNLTSLIAAAFIQQLVQHMQELMMAITANVMTGRTTLVTLQLKWRNRYFGYETATITITATPHTTRPVPTSPPFDEHQISMLREYFDSLATRYKHQATTTTTQRVTVTYPPWF